MDCAIVPRDLFAVQNRRPRRKSPWSWLCAGCVCQASRSLANALCPRRLSRGLLRHHRLHRHRLHRLALIDPSVPARRYERQRPGELIHLDIKKLARIECPSHRVTANRRDLVKGAGWEYVHLAIDDASRIAFARIMPDESKHSASAFLHNALAYFRSLGIEPQAIMSDNGACYISKLFAQSRQALGLRHLFTRPYTPRTNGKAEWFIQTSLREWAYARTYQHSNLRAAYLTTFLHHYNWHRPHTALHHHPPISKLNSTMNNLLSLHI
jgi:transposase InsO family protein